MTKKKFSFVIIFFIAGVVAAVFISSSAVREAYRSRKIEGEVSDLKLEAQRIQTENNDLKSRIAYFQTPEFQEKIAKEKLNLQKPDENVVVVKKGMEQAGSNNDIQNIDDGSEQQIPNYLKWWNTFFKYD